MSSRTLGAEGDSSDGRLICDGGAGTDTRAHEAFAKEIDAYVDTDEGSFDDLYERMTVGFFTVDEDWEVGYMNRRAADILEVDREDVIGEGLWESFSEAKDSVFQHKAVEAMVERHPVSFDGLYERLDKWFRVWAFPSEEGISVFFRDVTEWKEKEAKLERYGKIVEGCRDVLWMFDRGFTETLFVTSPYEEIFGQPKEALEDDATAFLEVTHPDDRDTLREKMGRVSEGEQVDFEIRVNPDDDYGRWVWIQGQPVYEDGEVVAVVGFSRDVTERKEHEQEVRSMKERLDLATDATSIGVWDWDAEADEISFDDNCAEMLGYSPEVKKLSSGDIMKYVHPDDLPNLNDEIWAHLLDETDHYDTEVRMRTAEGSWRWVRTIGKVAEDDDGTPLRVVGLHIDVDERKRNEERLEKGNEFLNSVLESSQEMIHADSAEDVYGVLEDFGAEMFEDAEFYVWEDGVLRSDDHEVPPEGGAVWTAFSQHDTVVTLPQNGDIVTEAYDRMGEYGTDDTAERDSLKLHFPVGNEGVLSISTGEMPPQPHKRFVDSLVMSAETKLETLEKERRLSDTAEKLEERNEELRQVSEIDAVIRQLMKSIVEADDTRSIQTTVCEKVRQVDGWDFSVFFEKDGDSVSVGCSCDDEEFAERLAEPLEGSPLSASLEDDEVRITDDVARVAKSDWRHAVLDKGYLSVATLPVGYGSRTFGVLEVYSSETHAFSGDYSEALVDASMVVGYAFTSVEQMESILSGGFNRITLRIKDDVRCFFSELVNELGEEVRINSVVPGGDGTTVYFKTEADGAAVRRVADEADIKISDTIDGHSATVPRMSVVQQAIKLGGRVSRYASDGNGLLVDVDIPQGTDARQLLNVVSEEYPRVELAARKTNETDYGGGTPLDDLTERQRTVLRLAYESGFFESPREMSGQDLADEMGITATTFHQHLRTAEKKLVDKLLDGSD